MRRGRGRRRRGRDRVVGDRGLRRPPRARGPASRTSAAGRRRRLSWSRSACPATTPASRRPREGVVPVVVGAAVAGVVGSACPRALAAAAGRALLDRRVERRREVRRVLLDVVGDLLLRRGQLLAACACRGRSCPVPLVVGEDRRNELVGGPCRSRCDAARGRAPPPPRTVECGASRPAMLASPAAPMAATTPSPPPAAGAVGAPGPAAPPALDAEQKATRNAGLLLLALVAACAYAVFADGAVDLPDETRLQVALVVVSLLAAVAWLAAGTLRSAARPPRGGAWRCSPASRCGPGCRCCGASRPTARGWRSTARSPTCSSWCSRSRWAPPPPRAIERVAIWIVVRPRRGRALRARRQGPARRHCRLFDPPDGGDGPAARAARVLERARARLRARDPDRAAPRGRRVAPRPRAPRRAGRRVPARHRPRADVLARRVPRAGGRARRDDRPGGSPPARARRLRPRRPGGRCRCSPSPSRGRADRERRAARPRISDGRILLLTLVASGVVLTSAGWALLRVEPQVRWSDARSRLVWRGLAVAAAAGRRDRRRRARRVRPRPARLDRPRDRLVHRHRARTRLRPRPPALDELRQPLGVVAGGGRRLLRRAGRRLGRRLVPDRPPALPHRAGAGRPAAQRPAAVPGRDRVPRRRPRARRPRLPARRRAGARAVDGGGPRARARRGAARGRVRLGGPRPRRLGLGHPGRHGPGARVPRRAVRPAGRAAGRSPAR